MIIILQERIRSEFKGHFESLGKNTKKYKTFSVSTEPEKLIIMAMRILQMFFTK